MTATTAGASHRWTDVGKRWPTALGLALGGFALAGDDPAGAVLDGYGELLPYAALLYLVVGKLGRRGLTWPVFALGAAVIVALRVVDVVSIAVVAAGFTIVALAWSATSGELRTSLFLRAQAAGVIGFGALALVGLTVEPDVGRHVVAGGWLLHGGWDIVHLRLDRVVSRSYAEFCGVFDILIGVGLAFVV